MRKILQFYYSQFPEMETEAHIIKLTEVTELLDISARMQTHAL